MKITHETIEGIFEDEKISVSNTPDSVVIVASERMGHKADAFVYMNKEQSIKLGKAILKAAHNIR